MNSPFKISPAVPAFVAYAPTRRTPLCYAQLVAKYGSAAFTKACAESKHSPLSVQEILELGSRAKTANPVATV